MALLSQILSSRFTRSLLSAVFVMPVISHPSFSGDSHVAPAYTEPESPEAGRPSSLVAVFSISEPRSVAATAPTSSPSAPVIEGPPRRGVDWKSTILQSASFLMIEQGFRIGTQPGTREALKGKFFDEWFKSVTATHGWGDGDDFLTNYIGHPMEGAVVGNIFVQNDPKGRKQVFNWGAEYWNSRLKAMAWSTLYSTQFELGPISEASIGNVGYQGSSLSGAVDLVITPLAGFGWQVGEDALDKYLVVRIERWTSNKAIQMFARGVLNPTRSFANVMRLTVPWARDTRPGIWRPSVTPH